MKKIINDPDRFVDDMMEGVLAAYPDQLKTTGELRNVIRAVKKDKVAIVSGGGSGHLPLFMGYVGEGLLDGCAVGGVFQSPSVNQIYDITKAVDSGKGVVYILGNYSGDNMNFDMSGEMAEIDDIRTAKVVGIDDIAAAPKGEEHKRRGIAGIFFVYKCAGAAAEAGKDFDEVVRIAKKANANIRTFGVALSPSTIPEVGRPSFTIAEDEMEIGMGIHGEPGVRRCKIMKAEPLVNEMLGALFADIELEVHDEVSVLVNGLGATPTEELMIVYRTVAKRLEEKGVKVFKVYNGEYATSMEMAGFSISLFKLDEELKSYLRSEAKTPFFEQVAF